MGIEKIELESLIGLHELSGCDFDTAHIPDDYYKYCNVINFVLDGITYTAIENPDDGYRSSLDQVLATDKPVKNTFPPVQVLCRMRIESKYWTDNILEIIDVVNGKVVLEVGTENVNDYYPTFVSDFIPENLHLNPTKRMRASGCQFTQ